MITIVGAGFVGLNTAYEIWTKDPEAKIHFIDKNPELINELENKLEIKAKEILNFKVPTNFFKNITFEVKDHITEENIEKSNIIFICVDTHYKENIFEKIKYILYKFENTINENYIVIRSTVPPETTNKLTNYFIYINHFCHFPERYSPGDNIKFDNIIGGDNEVIEKLQKYFKFKKIFDNPTITELSKIYENTQRFVLISLANAMKHVCNEYKINYYDILKAASTKENFIKLKPGLIGGECIGVDNHFLDYTVVKKINNYFDEINLWLGNYIYNNIVNIISKKTYFIGDEYKPNVYSNKESRIKEIILKIVKEKTNYFYGRKYLINLKDIENNYNNFEVKNPEFIILVAHDKIDSYLKHLKENKVNFKIAFDIREFLK